MSDQVTLSINDKSVTVPGNFTILQAARQGGVHIPTLCFLKDVNEVGACRVCLVEVEGSRGLLAACVAPVYEGMKVKTHTKKVRDSRKSTLELILASHKQDCLSCVRNKKCELQSLAEELDLKQLPYECKGLDYYEDSSSFSVVRDGTKCILCGRCVGVCKKIQGIGILDFANRGHETMVQPAFGMGLAQSPCIGCGQCIVNCPVAALKEKDNIEEVWEALENPKLHVIAQTAPAVRAALGEDFGHPIGTPVTGKMVAALKRLGFDKVFDTDFAADVTIMEEGYELLGRIQNGGTLPLITSCSPGWVKYCEHFYPELLPHLSTCKSPQQMFGALAKSYYAKESGIDPENIFVVSIMPCVAKKSEAKREEMAKDVDVVLTTREFSRMIKMAGIEFNLLHEEKFDTDLLGDSTGAGVIFGASGGVMEAAVRTVGELLEGRPLKALEFEELRGGKGIKEAVVCISGKDYRLAVVHGTGNAKTIMDQIKRGESRYDFIEIMGCSGGCVNGGGQPFILPQEKMDVDIQLLRAQALYKEDASSALRKSHENPLVAKLYKDFLGEPNSETAHKLLHTHYHAKERFSQEPIE